MLIPKAGSGLYGANTKKEMTDNLDLSEVNGHCTNKNINIRADLERLNIKFGTWQKRLTKNTPIFSHERKKGYPKTKGIFKSKLEKRLYFLRFF
jgi:hypothetical protein